MVRTCSIIDCDSRYVSGRLPSFLPFPRLRRVANEWLKYCKPGTIMSTAKVCTEHFLPRDYNKYARDMYDKPLVRLLPDAVPSRHLGPINQPSYSMNTNNTSSTETQQTSTGSTATQDIPEHLGLMRADISETRRNLKRGITPENIRYVREFKRRSESGSEHEFAVDRALRTLNPEI
ncbi:uncharacterized protein [Epargyreus clarus]|uniref:uncharacterized protein n=1 Tax=Epargyreus clarus TaxID=520877 RepID=UPI003C2B4CA8